MKPGGSPQPRRWIVDFLLREFALGLMVYVCSVAERAGNALLGLTLFLCALLWSSWDGVLPQPGVQRWIASFIEGSLLYVGTVMIANVLRIAFGQPPLGW